jgi:hypothetical protein
LSHAPAPSGKGRIFSDGNRQKILTSPFDLEILRPAIEIHFYITNDPPGLFRLSFLCSGWSCRDFSFGKVAILAGDGHDEIGLPFGRSDPHN